MADNDNNNGTALVLSALILGLALVGSSYLLKQSIDQGAVRLAEVQKALAARPAAAPSPTPSRPPNRAQRPDPNKVYQVAVADAPTKGPKNAAITIIEYSDFQ